MAVRLLVRCLAGMLAIAGIHHGGLSAEAPAAQVTVPLIVTDASGRPVRELEPGEIDVTAGGSRQTVSSLSFRGDRPARVAIYLDEFHVSPGDAAVRVRDALGRFIDRHVRPGDSLVVMKPLDAPSSIRALVDPEVARRRAAAFEGRRGDYAPRGAFESEYLSRAPGTADRQRAQVVRAGLESLAQAMGETPEAPGALILVSEGFSGTEPSRMRVTTLRTVGRAARLANLPVYVLDPSAGARAGSDHGLTPTPGGARAGQTMV